MIEIMHLSEPKGVGLAATQIGLPWQIIVVDIGDGPLSLINPKILSHKGKDWDKEGCLSLPGIYAEVERWSWIRATGLNREGKKIQIEGEGLLARVIQHEIDHLNGVLFIDRVKKWDTLEIVEGYPVPEELWKFIEIHAAAGSSKSDR
jgi:peptide deformylase